MNSLTSIFQARLLYLWAGLILTACGGGGGGGSPAPEAAATPSEWAVEHSVGVPSHLQPHPDGWALDIPHPNAEAGHVHYITHPTGPLTGKTKVTLRLRIEAAPGVRLVPTRFPDSPALLTVYFQRAGDSLTARHEDYRWYASFATVVGLAAGEYVIEAPLDANWTAVLTSSRANNPAGFQAALEHAARIGFVLGGGDGLGHGVYATGPARLIVTAFEVE